MESQKTRILLERYWEGESTLEEERLLTEYFGPELPATAEEAKFSALFQYRKILQEEPAETFDLSFLDRQDSEAGQPAAQESVIAPVDFNWRRWISVAAASIVLAIASVTYQWPKTQTLEAKSDEMERAYTETLAALQLVANKLNEGNSTIREISVFDRTTKQIIHEK